MLHPIEPLPILGSILQAQDAINAVQFCNVESVLSEGLCAADEVVVQVAVRTTGVQRTPGI